MFWKNTKQCSYSDFLQNKLLYGAIVYYTMIIGEASYKLSKQFKQKYTDTPWYDIESMRHHLVHGYYQVDGRILWTIITEDLPILKQQVEKYLTEIDWSLWKEIQ